jgi:acetyl-CoA carboxylase carboxyl transferase subunit alpha
MGMTSQRIYEMGLIDEIIPEPLGGAHRDTARMMTTLKSRLVANVERLQQIPANDLVAARYERLMRYGRVKE